MTFIQLHFVNTKEKLLACSLETVVFIAYLAFQFVLQRLENCLLLIERHLQNCGFPKLGF